MNKWRAIRWRQYVKRYDQRQEKVEKLFRQVYPAWWSRLEQETDGSFWNCERDCADEYSFEVDCDKLGNNVKQAIATLRRILRYQEHRDCRDAELDIWIEKHYKAQEN